MATPPPSGMSPLEQALRAIAGERLQAVRQREDGATVVIEAEGLDDTARATLEAECQAAATRLGAAPLRIAMTASRRRRRIVAVGSGKGGVGKSTLSANLAVALARLGRRTGLVDADIYGPSQPRLLGTEGQRPEAEGKALIPVPSRFGVPMLSMGHLVRPGQPIAWRGPMAGNALGQLIDAQWGDVDTLVVDLPPGTGDVQLTMLQKHKPAGAVIVSTPQDLALIDARKGLAMFRKVGVPVLGIVENMSTFVCPKCGEHSDIFGHGGAEAEALRLGVPFLGAVPLDMEIRARSDSGQPITATDPDGAHAQIFRDIAKRTWAELEQARELAVRPPRLEVSAKGDALTVEFACGPKYELSAELLRVMSPSAEVQGHSADQRVTVGAKRNVKIKELRPVGNYAIRIAFDDGHDTGLYTWTYLQQLGREKEKRWGEYLEELAKKGLSRG